MNFPYSMLLGMPWKWILILSMNLFPGFPTYQPLFLEQQPDQQPARKRLRIIPTEALVLLNPPDTNHCQKITSPVFFIEGQRKDEDSNPFFS